MASKRIRDGEPGLFQFTVTLTATVQKTFQFRERSRSAAMARARRKARTYRNWELVAMPCEHEFRYVIHPGAEVPESVAG